MKIQSPRAATFICAALISAALLAVIFVLYKRWHPTAWLHFTHAKVMWHIALAVSMLGPILLTLVYKENKKAFIFDIAVISSLHIAALAFCAHSLYQGKAAHIVFVKDDWRILRPIDLIGTSSANVMSGPQWNVAFYSDNPIIRDTQITDELMNGIPLEAIPANHQPVNNGLSHIQTAAKPLSALLKFNEKHEVQQVLNAWPEATGWLPLKGLKVDGVVLIDQQGMPITPVKLNPWNSD